MELYRYAVKMERGHGGVWIESDLLDEEEYRVFPVRLPCICTRGDYHLIKKVSGHSTYALLSPEQCGDAARGLRELDVEAHLQDLRAQPWWPPNDRQRSDEERAKIAAMAVALQLCADHFYGFKSPYRSGKNSTPRSRTPYKETP